ncbi:MAG: hypothetical protein M1820_010015 [Bogoriella megaspora]|nr:MAG: hypothetical protein M1820_010015 [Bogoriella megaspora]
MSSLKISLLFCTVVVPVFSHSVHSSHHLRRQEVNSTSQPCAQISTFHAASGSVVPAEIAYDCLESIPFHPRDAVDLVESLKPYISWQTTTAYLKNPPAEYFELMQPPFDLWERLDIVERSANNGTYESEWDFAKALLQVTIDAHDGHLLFPVDVAADFFSFTRSFSLVSVSTDGHELPQVYVYSDVVASYGTSNLSSSNAGTRISAVTAIDGQNATEYLLDYSESGAFLRDRDALWNNLFFNLAGNSQGTPLNFYFPGIFTGGLFGGLIYSGPNTTINFANGTSKVFPNYAVPLADFGNIKNGEDIWKQCIKPKIDSALNGSSAAASTNSSATSATSQSTSPTVHPAPGYPPFVLAQGDHTGENPSFLGAGFYINDTDYDDVAVLAIPTFGTDNISGPQYQKFVHTFLQQSRAAGKTKLIIDTSGNSGGIPFTAIDLFAQLFPQEVPYQAIRYRAHQDFNSVGQTLSALPQTLDASGQYPLGGSVEVFAEDQLNYHIDLDANGNSFNSFAEFFGPQEIYNDTFTNIFQYNLSNPFASFPRFGFYVSGFGESANFSNTTQPYAAEDIIILSDGTCSSACNDFVELMTMQGGVKTVAFGGRPQAGNMQAVGGTRGSLVEGFSAIKATVDFTLSTAKSTGLNDSSVARLKRYNTLPTARSSSLQEGLINTQSLYRKGDSSNTPLQFIHSPADCRMLFTPEMIIDITAIWKRVADGAWGGQD